MRLFLMILTGERLGENEGSGTVRNLDSINVLFSVVYDGGEGGIRTQSAPVESVTYRFYIAYDAIFATVAVGHCSFLLTGPEVVRPCRPQR